MSICISHVERSLAGGEASYVPIGVEVTTKSITVLRPTYLSVVSDVDVNIRRAIAIDSIFTSSPRKRVS